jgi:hypothetical protein
VVSGTLAGIGLSGVTVAAVVGAVAAWWLHRRTQLSAVNFYLAWAAAVVALVAAVASQQIAVMVVAGIVLDAATVAVALARRWRLAALGAGGELRQHELARRMVWQPAPLSRGERVQIAGQGELIRERPWPWEVAALPMTGDGRARIPLGEGMHLYFVGATGSGKTTSARRWLLARGLRAGQTALLALDPKGDAALERDLRAAAAARGRPFVLFDPFDSRSDRWNPIWAEDPGAVVARLVAPVEADSDSDASHYSRVLRVHLGVVAEALAVAGRWPVALPVLLRCAQRTRFDRVVALAREHDMDNELRERIDDHQAALRERVTQGQLDGSLRALEVVAGQAWRRVLAPDEHRGAVTLPVAMAAGAVVLWHTHVEEIKEEAETITTLALADIGAAARTLPEHAEWALLIDEFGSVLQGRAGERAVALLQRARSSHGQVGVSTQSVSDVASATGNPELLESLTDNFTGFVLHRQTSPASRDWVAMLLGTRELWQSTDRTTGGGTRAEGMSSRRRAAEFIVRPDDFKRLRPGEAVVWTTLGPAPEQVEVTAAPIPPAGRVSSEDVYRPLPRRTLEDALGAPAGGEDPAEAVSSGTTGEQPGGDLFA